MHNEQLSLATCYWYAQLSNGIVPIGSNDESIQQRPDCVHT